MCALFTLCNVKKKALYWLAEALHTLTCLLQTPKDFWVIHTLIDALQRCAMHGAQVKVRRFGLRLLQYDFSLPLNYSASRCSYSIY